MMDLRFVSTDDMIRELQSRFDETIFMGAARMAQKNEDMTMAFSGPFHACLGLIEIARSAMKTGGIDDDDDRLS